MGSPARAHAATRAERLATLDSQIFFATYDMKVHTTDVDSDLTQLWCGLREEISLVSSGGENVGGQSGFAHIAGGYDAGYYGYL